MTSDVPENREVVEGAGFTFRRGDVETLAGMLGRLIPDRNARVEAGQNARRRVHQNYLWPEIVERIESVYLEMMGLPARCREARPRRVA